MGRQPMTGMDDLERQTPHGDTEILDKKNKAARNSWIGCIAMIVTVLVTLCYLVSVFLFDLEAHYYVAIDSVSDLDQMKELSFNLTIGLSSWGLATKSCLQPGTYAQVSYRGFPVALSDPYVGRLCGRRGKSVEQHVSARLTGVPVESLMDSLATDVRQGTAVLDIMLHLPAGSYDVDDGGENWLSGCRGSRVGDAAVRCDSPKQEPTS